MEDHSQIPAAHGTPPSSEMGAAADHGAAIDGTAHQEAESPTTSSSSLPPAVAKKQTRCKSGKSTEHPYHGCGGATVVAPRGFERVCALLSEAIVGMTPGTGSEVCNTSAPGCSDSKRPSVVASDRTPAEIDEQIVQELRESGSASPVALRAKLGLQRTPCTKALNRLLAKGVLIGEGSTRNRVYRLPRSGQSAAA